MQIEQLKPIIEAALLATTQPMTIPQLLELFGEEDEVGRDEVAKALEALTEDCTGRGVELQEVASGFRYQVRQEMHPWLSKMWTERPSRYSRALLETLALIAYRQPITRPEIEQIRGVVVSSSIIKTMEEREWIRVVGHRDVPGRPALFGTTRAFLDYFNLKSLDELPPLSEIRDMEDPQMRFDQNPLPARIVRDLPIDPDEENEPLVVAGEEAEAVTGETSEPTDSDEAQAPAVTEAPSEEQALTIEVADASSEPGAATHAESPTDTADEAATRADADHGDATQDTEEYRA
jgi:segregation and condensation protein B